MTGNQKAMSSGFFIATSQAAAELARADIWRLHTRMKLVKRVMVVELNLLMRSRLVQLVAALEESSDNINHYLE